MYSLPVADGLSINPAANSNTIIAATDTHCHIRRGSSLTGEDCDDAGVGVCMSSYHPNISRYRRAPSGRLLREK